MQLAHRTDLALRVLMYVGYLQDRRPPVTIREIAQYFQASQEHLRKVVQRLARLGWLVTARGRGGGVKLGKAAAQINLAEVVAAMEQDLWIVDCSARSCFLDGGCSLKAALMDGQRAFLEALRAYTLQTLLDSGAVRRRMALEANRRRVPIAAVGPNTRNRS